MRKNCAFSLWGINDDAGKSDLDERLVGVDGLKNTLLAILSGLGDTLVALAMRLNTQQLLGNACSLLQSLRSKVPETTSKPALHDEEDEIEIPALDELSSLKSENSSSDELAELEELLRDA